MTIFELMKDAGDGIRYSQIMKGFISHEAGGALEWMLRP